MQAGRERAGAIVISLPGIREVLSSPSTDLSHPGGLSMTPERRRMIAARDDPDSHICAEEARCRFAESRQAAVR
jgi:hypothetical protein